MLKYEKFFLVKIKFNVFIFNKNNYSIGKTVRSIISTLMLLIYSTTWAASKSVGTVWMVKGQVQIQMVTGSKSLRLGDEISNGDVIVSANYSEAVLMMIDGAKVAVRPNSHFQIVDIRMAEESSAAFVISLIKGGLRLITGLIGQQYPQAYSIRTPVATIGIRGTDHETYVLSNSEKIAPNPSGTYDKVNSGSTYIKNDSAITDLQPGQVGYIRDIPSTRPDERTRAMATLLRPVILRYIPEFFKDGIFDSGLYNQDGLKNSGKNIQCDINIIARKWLGALDGAIADRRPDYIIDLFSSDVNITINPQSIDSSHKNNVPTGLLISREEFITSIMQLVKNIEEFRQTRKTIHVESLSLADPCSHIKVTSEVDESSRAAGKTYESSTLESYELKRSVGGFTATSVEVYPLSGRP